VCECERRGEERRREERRGEEREKSTSAIQVQAHQAKQAQDWAASCVGEERITKNE
jgi:hypothetical protein